MPPKACRVIYYICGYIYSIFISHTPHNWICLRLPLLHCDSWHTLRIFCRPARTHMSTWAEVSRVTRGRTSPPQYKRMKEKMSLVQYQVSCTAKTITPTLHAHTQNGDEGVSHSTGNTSKEITLPAAQPLNEWKFDWSDFPICVCLSRLVLSEWQRQTAPDTLFMSLAAKRGAELQIKERKLKNKVLLSHKYRTRESAIDFFKPGVVLWMQFNIWEKRDQDFHNLMIKKRIKKKEGINYAICQYAGLTRFQGNDISRRSAAARSNPITLPSGFHLVMACFKWLTLGRLPLRFI